MKLLCPHCQQKLEAPPEMYGQLTVCPSCANELQIPAAPIEVKKYQIETEKNDVVRLPNETDKEFQQKTNDWHYVSCHHCNQKLRINDNATNKARCPVCKFLFEINTTSKNPTQSQDHPVFINKVLIFLKKLFKKNDKVFHGIKELGVSGEERKKQQNSVTNEKSNYLPLDKEQKEQQEEKPIDEHQLYLKGLQLKWHNLHLEEQQKQQEKQKERQYHKKSLSDKHCRSLWEPKRDWNALEEKFKRKNEVRWRPNNSQYIDEMSGIEYENYCKVLLEKKYWECSLTPKSGDQGADIIAERHGKRIAFQCKRYTASVGNKAIQEVYAAKGHYKADSCAVVSNANYTKSARELAKSLNVLLLHHSDLDNI